MDLGRSLRRKLREVLPIRYGKVVFRQKITEISWKNSVYLDCEMCVWVEDSVEKSRKFYL